MKQKEIFTKIGGIIKELNDQYEYLQTVTDELNDLELELFVSNAHFLADHIEILCKLNLQNKKAVRQPVEKPEVAYKQKFFEPVVQQMKTAMGIKESRSLKSELKPAEPDVIKQNEEEPIPQIELGSEGPEDTYSFIREEPETIRHELILDETSKMDDDDEYPLEEYDSAIALEKEETDAVVKVGQTTHAAEKNDFNLINNSGKTALPNTDTEDEVYTINQKISSQLKDKTASKTEQVSIKPITDIKLAITLNDKLLYVKDLFNGYNLAYSEAIEILNRFNTFEEASRFLKTNYVIKNNWAGKPETTEKFYALLKRRYT